MRIMTSNIWGDYFGNPVSERAEQLYRVYKSYAPDVIGMQEATGSWYLSTLFRNLQKDGYVLVGTNYVFTEDCSCPEGVPLFEGCSFVPMAVKTDKFKILDMGFELLRNTPDPSKSISWAVLENKADGSVCAVMNTHFWWMERNEEDFLLRAENAKQLTALMKHINEKHSCPVFAFGDMNSRFGSQVFEVYEENNIKCLINEAEKASQVSSCHGNPQKGEDGKFRGTKTKEDKTRSLDHIIGLGEGYKVKNYVVVEDADALDATDHSPVYADIEL